MGSFDSLDHDLLMAHLRRRIKDPTVLNLLQTWLDAGVMHAGPPADPALMENGLGQSAASAAQRGLDWMLQNALESDPYDAYRQDVYRPYAEGDLAAYANTSPLSEGDYANRMRQASVRRLATNGLMLGAGLLRPALRRLAGFATQSFNTPAGPRMLKQGAWASAGLAGVAALSAAAAYVLQRRAGPAPTGILQGSPLSPLLANIYLHPFDVTLTRRGHHLARFADDFVITCPTQAAAETAYNDALRTLAHLRLKLNPQKTHILPPNEPLEWLGVSV